MVKVRARAFLLLGLEVLHHLKSTHLEDRYPRGITNVNRVERERFPFRVQLHPPEDREATPFRFQFHGPRRLELERTAKVIEQLNETSLRYGLECFESFRWSSKSSTNLSQQQRPQFDVQ
jgi:hypothetical protein